MQIMNAAGIAVPNWPGASGAARLVVAAPPHLAEEMQRAYRARAAGLQRLDDRAGDRAVRSQEMKEVPAADREPRHLVVAGLPEPTPAPTSPR